VSRKRVRFGKIFADELTFAETIERVIARAKAGEGGYVLTPNVDHVCLAEEDPELVEAYEHCFLSTVDGQPLVWLARAMGHPLPEKISGSDLVHPLVGRAAEEGVSVFFLGAREGIGQRAADRLARDHPGLEVAGVYSPPLGFEEDPEALERTINAVNEAKPGIVLVALGCPKQEKFLYRHRDHLEGAVSLGIGATLDFLAGEVERAPRWMQGAGLEWAYRLGKEPRRMYDRYLVRDRAIARISARMMRMPRDERAFYVE
jgi:N-acetylglucosaminyldiphosphoundecaprenol N-acetyl-beta-D-mannosaminyltransferase